MGPYDEPSFSSGSSVIQRFEVLSKRTASRLEVNTELFAIGAKAKDVLHKSSNWIGKAIIVVVCIVDYLC